MSWYNEAVFYHIYPLGLAGAPKQNEYGEPVHRLNTLLPWIDHIKEIGCTALYIGPLFESVGHGYETTDYRNHGFQTVSMKMRLSSARESSSEPYGTLTHSMYYMQISTTSIHLSMSWITRSCH